MAKITAEINEAVEPTEAAAPDPFDLSKLRLDQSFTETVGVKKLLHTVPVGKPNPQDFVRVHPNPDYRDTLALVEWSEDREYYVLTRDVALALPGEFFMMTLFTCINRQGVVRLVPVKLPNKDGKWNEWPRSMMAAMQVAMRRWVRIKSNTSLGAYETFEAETNYGEPELPEATFQELLRVAFSGDHLVNSLGHPLVKKLRGSI